MAEDKINALITERDYLQNDEDEMVMTEAKVMERSIPWDKLVGPYLDKEDLSLLKKYDALQGALADKGSMLEQDGGAYARIFMVLVAKIQKTEYLQYVLFLIDEILTDNTERALLFYALKDMAPDQTIQALPFGPLISLLQKDKNDWYINAKACSVLTMFFMEFPKVDEENEEFFFAWLVDQLSKDDKTKTIAVTSLQSLLRKNNYRSSFVKERGLEALTNMIQVYEPGSYEEEDDGNRPNFQLLYQTIYCIWCLSFNKRVIKTMKKAALVTALCDIVKYAKVTKVRRVSIATLRNILDIGHNKEIMISSGLLRTIDYLATHKNLDSDEDVEADIKHIEEVLNDKFQALSTFDVYKTELLSQKLDWTPSHKSEKFWRENIFRFDEEDYQLLKVLKQILVTSTIPRVLAVGCYDVGEFVRFHVRGKAVASHLDLKSPIMALLEHDDAEVRKHSLLALQKLMVTHWEYL